MATKKEDTKEEVKEVKQEELEPRIHVNEFGTIHAELDEMQKAGLKAFSGGKEWMTLDEWNKSLKKYLN